MALTVLDPVGNPGEVFEDIIRAAIAAEVAPLVAEVRALREEVAALRELLPPVLVSVQAAAERLGVSVPTIRRRVRDGSLPSRRIGRALRVDLSRVHGLDSGDVARLARSAAGRASAH